jgi:UTP--glucose-1-phosphate uridylyltransferase
LCAKPVIGNEPFAVILADDLIDGGDSPCMAQMASAFEYNRCSVLGVEQVPQEETYKYGIIEADLITEGLRRVSSIIEKPRPEEAPTNLAVVGRYILTPRIFDLLESTPRGAGGEIQLTDAIAALLKEEQVMAYQFRGERYDCGSKLGYLKATIEYAMQHDELKGEFLQYLRERFGEDGSKIAPLIVNG